MSERKGGGGRGGEEEEGSIGKGGNMYMNYLQGNLILSILFG